MYNIFMPKLTIVLPSWEREELTLRMLTSISLQTFQDYELFFLGDCCPIFDKVIQSDDFSYLKNVFGNRIIVKNFDTHDGTSAQAINYAVENMNGEYFIFLSNDDLIFPNHFDIYYNSTKDIKEDFSIFNTSVDYGNGVLVTRKPVLAPSKIGHSELCISKKMIQSLPPHSRVYGHDWEFISRGLQSGFKYKMFDNIPTYIVNLSMNRGHNWEGGRIV